MIWTTIKKLPAESSQISMCRIEGLQEQEQELNLLHELLLQGHLQKDDATLPRCRRLASKQVGLKCA